MNTSLRTLVAGIVFTVGASALNAHECADSQTLFDEGLAAGKAGQWSEAITALKTSTTLCARFDNWYLLGQAQLASEQFTPSEQAFIQARRFAQDDAQIALSLARYAEARNAQGYASEASNLLHDARALHPSAPDWMTQLALKIDASLAKEAI